LGSFGWDQYYGAGRLNMLNLSRSEYESSIFIHEPKSGSSTANDLIPVVITAQDADLLSINLEYGFGENPVQWHNILSEYNYQVIKDTIATFDISSFPDTTIVLKLSAKNISGQRNEYHSIFEIDKTPPKISNIKKTYLYDGDHRSVLLEFETDDVCLATIFSGPHKTHKHLLQKI